MADDYSQRSYRRNEQPARAGQSRASGPGANDPLAELARLIGQNDPFGEYGHRDNAPHPQAPSYTEEHAEPDDRGYDRFSQPQDRRIYEEPVLGGQLPSYLTERSRNAPEQAPDDYEDGPYDQSLASYNSEDQEFYDDYDEQPRRRSMGITIIAGIFGLAILGTAGAFGYRVIFGSSSAPRHPPVIKADATPSKIVPANAGKDSSKVITDRLNDRGERIVSREEQPIDMKANSGAAAFPSAPGPANAASSATSSGIVASEPKKVHTIAIRPDGTLVASAGPNAPVPVQPARPPVAAPPVVAPEPQVTPTSPQRDRQPIAATPTAPQVASAPAGNAPLSLSPSAPAARRPAPPPLRTASATPSQPAPAATAAVGGYGVQITSQRSEAEAQAALRGLQAKYPSQLGGKKTFIHKVSLGAKGIYYRAMIGPFANANAASELCSSLKAAGGQCIVQKN